MIIYVMQTFIANLQSNTYMPYVVLTVEMNLILKTY